MEEKEYEFYFNVIRVENQRARLLNFSLLYDRESEFPISRQLLLRVLVDRAPDDSPLGLAITREQMSDSGWLEQNADQFITDFCVETGVSTHYIPHKERYLQNLQVSITMKTPKFASHLKKELLAEGSVKLPRIAEGGDEKFASSHAGSAPDSPLFALFTKLSSALLENPAIEVLSFELGPRMDDKITEALTGIFPRPMLDFYRNANGIRLQWVHKDWFERFGDSRDAEVFGGSLQLDRIEDPEPYSLAEQLLTETYGCTVFPLGGHVDVPEHRFFWGYAQGQGPADARLFVLDESLKAGRFEDDLGFTEFMCSGLATGFGYQWLETALELEFEIPVGESISEAEDDDAWLEKILMAGRIRFLRANAVGLAELTLPPAALAHCYLLAGFPERARPFVLKAGMTEEQADRILLESSKVIDALCDLKFTE
jgi:hypothetical protein